MLKSWTISISVTLYIRLQKNQCQESREDVKMALQFVYCDFTSFYFDLLLKAGKSSLYVQNHLILYVVVDVAFYVLFLTCTVSSLICIYFHILLILYYSCSFRWRALAPLLIVTCTFTYLKGTLKILLTKKLNLDCKIIYTVYTLVRSLF